VKNYLKAFLLMIIIIHFLGKILFSQTVTAPIPDTIKTPISVTNPLPLSEIDIPVIIDLKPIYAFANRTLDTLYTSPNYPRDWVQEACDVRYQYRFVRGPIQFRATQNTLLARFTGFYGVRGSTRICSRIGNSPWTPSCSCGFGTEAPRKIDAGFALQFKLQPDYRIHLDAKLTDPVALDKCEVCFFGKDITKMVATQLKDEMAVSLKEMQVQLNAYSLKTYIQTVWDSLQTPYAISGLGFLNMQPQSLRISQAVLRNDSMSFSLGISARPELKNSSSFTKKPLPNLSDFSQRGGFSLFVAQLLSYDSLNAIANAMAAGNEFTVGKGILKKTIRIDSLRLLGGGEKIFIQVYLSKGIKGIVYLEGKPIWDPVQHVMEIKDMTFEIRSRQILVKSAAWLLDGTIEKKMKEYTRFDVKEKADLLRSELTTSMNRELMPGIKSKGAIEQMFVEKLIAQPDGVFVGGNIRGRLWVTIDAGTLINKCYK
jgi:hypothetical protein